MSEISAQQLQTHVEALAGVIGEHNVFHPEALAAAAAYISEQWRRQGYRVGKQGYRVEGMECNNLEVTCHGTQRGDQVILIGAHYDSVCGSPGANDNGSGVAALLELSRRFKEAPPAVSLRFVAFVNEEPPFFYWGKMGSMIYAEAAKRRGDPIRYMVSLETIGYYSSQPGSQHYPPFLSYFYPDTGNFIAFASNLGSRRVMRHCLENFAKACDFPAQSIAAPAVVPGISWSDHLAFWRHGFEAFMITDTAPYRYPYYHTSEDTPDKLDYLSFARVANGLFSMLAAER
ncbi:M28 family peptidase [Methylomicrobium lacus]|uniref:M28 family peptidase n=1 Tax=Methylomicrobium lacus TaxID=136992 RepID=UPI00045EA24E|nr:M28 family peptidase [Methylomicrobium lacus]